MNNRYLSQRRDYYLKLKNELIDFKEYALSNLGVVITMLYFIGSIAGLLYLKVLLDSFGIDVFNHIELSDYLLALLSNGQIMLAFTGYFSITSFLIFLSLKRDFQIKKDTKFNRIFCRLSAPLYAIPPLLSFIVVSIFILFSYSWTIADTDAQNVRKTNGETYNITLTYPINVGGADLSQLNNVNLLTSTNSNLFVFDRQLDQLIIVPHANVAALIPIFKRDEEVAKSESSQLSKQSQQD